MPRFSRASRRIARNGHISVYRTPYKIDISHPANRPARICCAFMLPGSRWPRVRDPITKSCVPAAIGSTSCFMNSGQSLPSPSRKTTMSHSGRTAATPAAHARPYPRGALTTRAPASRPRSAVRSVLPLSTTMISAGILVAAISRTTPAIGSSSFSAGMTTETDMFARASRS